MRIHALEATGGQTYAQMPRYATADGKGTNDPAQAVKVNGRSDVRDQTAREQIVGTPDMTPAAIKAEAAKAGLKNVDLPTCSVAGQKVDTGSEARCFAQYMRVHTLEATGGQTYAQMPRYATADGKGTNDEAAAVKNEKTGGPLDNPARNIWVTETALTTALQTSYFAEQVSLFTIVMGVALLLIGIGFGIVSIRLLKKEPEEADMRVPGRTAVPAH
jgi:hypothetical protein